MSLTALQQLGDHTVEWRDDTLDIARRIQQGDELWRGDPQMELRFNFIEQRFEVWGVDAHGDGYLAASHPRRDHALLTKLTAGDWQRGREVAVRVLLHERALEAERKAKEADERGEVIDKLRWAIRRDLHGTRGTFGQVGEGPVTTYNVTTAKHAALGAAAEDIVNLTGAGRHVTITNWGAVTDIISYRVGTTAGGSAAGPVAPTGPPADNDYQLRGAGGSPVARVTIACPSPNGKVTVRLISAQTPSYSVESFPLPGN